MDEQKIIEYSDEFYERLNDDIEVSKDQIRERFKKFSEYSIPLESIEEQIARNLCKKHNISESQLFDEVELSKDSLTAIDNIDEPDEWLSIRGKILTLFDDIPESAEQVGLIGDETGVIKFTRWDSEDDIEFVEGEVYAIQSGITNEFNGKIDVQLQSNTRILELDEDVDVPEKQSNQPERDTELLEDFALVDVYDGEGLIKRDPETGRVIRDSENGDGEFDLRIKGTIDNGEETKTIILGSEIVSELMDITIEEAKQKAQDEINMGIIGEEFKEEFCPTFWQFEGFQEEYGFVCTDIQEPDMKDVKGKIESLSVKLRNNHTNQGEQQ